MTSLHTCVILLIDSAPVFGPRSMRPKRGKTAKINSNLIMQNYELLFVLPGTLSDEETAPTVEKVKGIIEKNNGLEYSLEAMDKKRLAYPIKHIRYGYFYLAFFKAEQKDAVQMQKELKVMPELLRAILQKHDPKKQTIRKIDFGEMIQSAPAYSERVEPVRGGYVEPAVYNAPTQSTVVSTPAEAEVVASQSAPTEQVAVQAPVLPPVKKAESKKISLEEIDKKLDEILDIDLGSV